MSKQFREEKIFVFTDVQFELFQKLTASQFFSFSGPTSMGKSFLIKAFINLVLNNKPPENIAIIVPTRALINQFSLDLKNEIRDKLDSLNYKVLTNSNLSELDDFESFNYILVLTPERLISYMSQSENPPIGFLFLDEAHKLAEQNDYRSITTYTAIEKVLKKFPNVKLYFSSPLVTNPEVFLSLFNKDGKNSFTTNEAPVTQNIFFIDLIKEEALQYVGNKPLQIDFKLLDEVNDSNELISKLGKGYSNIIYCNSRSYTVEKAFEFSQIQTQLHNLDSRVRNAIQQIKSYVHKDYYLVDFLQNGVAYHYGNLPQIIRNIVEDLYKEELIQYLFCTSTLLEGVNLPAKNIFILQNKKGNRKNFENIDFWNLAGRAGRLTKELSGNIYCVREKERHWKNVDYFTNRSINLNPTIAFHSDKNISKIEKLLKGEDIEATKRDKEILQYITNIISVNTIESRGDNQYQSPIIQLIKAKGWGKVLELAEEKTKDIKVPVWILNSNESIDLKIQNKVYEHIVKHKDEPSKVKLPNSFTLGYESILETLEYFYRLYDWDTFEEKELKNKNRLRYYAFLVNQWLDDKSLSQIINESISYNSTVKDKEFYINRKPVGPFDKKNKLHVNALINDLIEDIEKVLRFRLEKYFNHYYQLLVEVFGEEKAGENIAVFLEYGTKNRIVIALQNLGFSRHTSTTIVKYYNSALEVENSKLKAIDKVLLLKLVDTGTIEYEEVTKVL